MTDETQVESESTQESQSNNEIALLQQELDALRNKTQELLSEKKKMQQKAQAAEQQAEHERKEKAKKSGDFEQLLKSSEKEREVLAQELNSLRTSISQEKTRSQAMKVASELADGPNAELLSEFVARRLKYTEDGVKVLSENGELTVSTLDHLKQEIIASGKYDALLRGNKSTGGSATGSKDTSDGAATIKRSAFESKTPAQQMAFIKAGGKLTD